MRDIRGKLILILIMVGSWSATYGQIPPYQIQYAPDSTFVIGALSDGEPAWVKFRRLDSLYGVGGVTDVDSIYMRNDTIYLRDGSGFVKVPGSNAILTNGTHISVTGTGSNANPYVITNTMPFQTLSTNNTPGNISLSNGGGTLSLNVNDADSVATNELQDLYPYSTGFNLSNPNISLQDTVLFDYQASGSGSFVPASNYIAGAGINITGNTISSTVTNTDAQAISKSGNVISITGNASTVNIANGTPSEGQVMTWQSGNWVATTPSAGIQFFDAIINSPFSGTSGTPTVLTLSLAAGTYKTDAFCKISNETASANTLSLQLFNQTTGATLFTSSAQLPANGSVTIPVARNFTISSTNTIGLRVSTSFNFFINTNECILNALKVN